MSDQAQEQLAILADSGLNELPVLSTALYDHLVGVSYHHSDVLLLLPQQLVLGQLYCLQLV
jgi:hypothetical protein